jgi:hypothetical protein
MAFYGNYVLLPPGTISQNVILPGKLATSTTVAGTTTASLMRFTAFSTRISVSVGVSIYFNLSRKALSPLPGTARVTICAFPLNSKIAGKTKQLSS